MILDSKSSKRGDRASFFRRNLAMQTTTNVPTSRSSRGWALSLAVIGAVMAAAPTADAQATDPEAAKLQAVMQRIRRNMREVNELLLNGTAGERTSELAQETAEKIEELLFEAQSKSESVVGGIEELIQMAKAPQSCQSGSPQEQSQEPQPQNQPKREKSEEPQDLAKQDNPEQQPKPHESEQPKSPRPDNSPASQDPAKQPPPRGETGEFEQTDLSGRWGVLPPKDAEDLQRHDIDDFPARYRHWMELYYRRVNQTRDSGN